MWNWDPIIGAALMFTVWRYMNGVWQLWKRAGTGRGISQLQVGLFWTGIAILFIALISPLDGLSEKIFSAHMVQHLMLILFVPPLLVIAIPPFALAWAVPQPWRRSLARFQHQTRVRRLTQMLRLISQPTPAWFIHMFVIWFWHIPTLYQLALESSIVHAIEHISFLLAGLIYWYSLLQKRNTATSVLSLFGTVIVSSLLGALLTFSSSPWYNSHLPYVHIYSLSAIEDQQIAGLIMWVPVGIVYTASALSLLLIWLNRMEQTVPRQR